MAGPPLYYFVSYRCADLAPARERSHPCLSHFVLARCVFAESICVIESIQLAVWTRAGAHTSNFVLRPNLGGASSAAVGSHTGSIMWLTIEDEPLAWCKACRCALYEHTLRMRRGSPACAAALPSNSRLPH